MNMPPQPFTNSVRGTMLTSADRFLKMEHSMRARFTIAFLAASISSGVMAQESCSPLLQDGIRNNFYERYDRRFIDEFHSAMCSEESSQIDRAKSNGLDLGYSDFVANFAGNSRKIAAYQSAMCASESDVSRGSTFYELTRNHVSTELAEAYVRCIEIQSGGIIYEVSNGADGDSINMSVGYDIRTRVGKGVLTISHIVISPERFRDKVSCEGSLVDALNDGPIDVTNFNGLQTLTCRPLGEELTGDDNDFSVFVHTSLGIIEGYVNPYHAGKDDRIDALDDRLAAAAAELGEQISANKVTYFHGKMACDNRRDTIDVRVNFPSSFRTMPSVVTGFSRYGTGTGDSNTRGRASVKSIALDHFIVSCGAWDGTRGDYEFSWLAVGR